MGLVVDNNLRASFSEILRLVLALVGFWFVFGSVLPSHSETQERSHEVRILDSRGMLRAFKRVSSVVRVVVVLGPRGGSAEGSLTGVKVILSNIDGLSADQEAQSDQNGNVEFLKVSPGLWKVASLGSSARVKSVQIHP